MYYLCGKSSVKLPKFPVADLNWVKKKKKKIRNMKYPHPLARNI